MINNIDIIDKTTLITPMYVIKQFPIYMGCVEADPTFDRFLDLEFGISERTGIIQVCNYPTDADIYTAGSHNNAYGKMWHTLFDTLVTKIGACKSIKRIYEIGGGNGKLFSHVCNKIHFEQYIMYEPNAELLNVTHPQLTIINKYFTTDDIMYDADIIIHSHVLEHISDPHAFLKTISLNMTSTTYHIFAIPNLLVQFQKKYTNCLMFEHKNFITDTFVDYMLNDTGMEIIEKDFLHNHSIIYTVKKTDNPIVKRMYPCMYKEYSMLLDTFFEHYTKKISNINNEIIECVKQNKQIFIFGAHIFTQFLIKYGMDSTHIEYILDNDQFKLNKRLYGTNLYVKAPTYIERLNCAVVLNVASYKDEIMEQLYKLNSTIYII